MNFYAWRLSFSQIAVPLLVLFVTASVCLPSARAADATPQLVVVVSVDQYCQEYFDRFRGGFSDEGLLHRIGREGLQYTNCHHRHAFTYTAPGHSVLMTGAYPNRNGIVGNNWFDRATGKVRYCVEEPASGDVRLVGAVGNGTIASPRIMLVDTVGDTLKLATGGKSRVFGVAFKDRASILMAGHLADAAYWFDGDSGNWVTSTHYRNDLPGYLRNLNEERQINRYAGQTWELLHPAEKYHRYYADDDERFERPIYGMTRDFPHRLPPADDSNFLKQLPCTPFGNDATLDAAWAVIEGEKLGQGETPDVLVVNLSSNDYVGHAFGPHSLEVQDMTYRTDLQLGQFVHRLEKYLDGKPWILFLSADHAVGPVPEYAKSIGLPAKRQPLGNLSVLERELEGMLIGALGHDEGEPLYVLHVEESQVYLNHEHPRLAGEGLAEACRRVRDRLLKNENIVRAATRDELLAGAASDAQTRMLQRAFHAERSGDVLFILKPYMLQDANMAASHGTPWKYDTHVPLLVLGSHTEAQVIEKPVSPANIGPTVARILRVPMPAGAEEEALEDVIKSE